MFLALLPFLLTSPDVAPLTLEAEPQEPGLFSRYPETSTWVFHWNNDNWGYGDDDRRTNELVLNAFWLTPTDAQVGAAVGYEWLTESGFPKRTDPETRPPERTDLLTALVHYGRIHHGTGVGWRLDLGVQTDGNYGGSKVQDAWHKVWRWAIGGRSLGTGNLQSKYPAKRRARPLVGGELRKQFGLGTRGAVSLGLDGRYGLVSYLRQTTEVSFFAGRGFVLFANFSVAGYYATGELEDGYESEIQTQPGAGVWWMGRRAGVGYEVTAFPGHSREVLYRMKVAFGGYPRGIRTL